MNLIQLAIAAANVVILGVLTWRDLTTVKKLPENRVLAVGRRHIVGTTVAFILLILSSLVSSTIYMKIAASLSACSIYLVVTHFSLLPTKPLWRHRKFRLLLVTSFLAVTVAVAISPAHPAFICLSFSMLTYFHQRKYFDGIHREIASNLAALQIEMRTKRVESINQALKQNLGGDKFRSAG